MPVSPLRDRIATALQDNRVSRQEVKDLIAAAKAEPKFTPEMKADLQALVDQSRFDFFAKGDLRKFLDTAVPQIDLPDPTILDKHSTSVSWKPVAPGGALFVDGVNFDDVVQGSIGDCYLAAAFSSLAYTNPDIIKNAITENPDGTYGVRFFEKRGATYEAVTVTIDSDLPVETGTRAKYAKARNEGEHWVSMLEKAYAQWKGNYEAIGNGGNSGAVFEALTGKKPEWTSTAYSGAEVLYTRLEKATASGRPVTAGTHGKDSGVDYTGTGVYAWHAYTVLGASEDAGTKYVELRNPWGRSEHGSDGKDDGIFKMKLDDFMKLYNSINIGG